MKLIIGLGNPGSEYSRTRHNVGFMVVDELASLDLPSGTVIKKSDRFMNDSGEFVAQMVDKYKVKMPDLYIIHDDLDIKLGEYKIQEGRGPKDHNGIRSINQELGDDSYWHVRVGIDNRPLDNRPMGEEYVLQNFTQEEQEILNKVIVQVAKRLVDIK